MAGEQELDIVKISYEDIKRIVLSSRSDQESRNEGGQRDNQSQQHHNKPRRPSQQIYRPGKRASGKERQTHGHGSIGNECGDNLMRKGKPLSAEEEESWETETGQGQKLESLQKGLDDLILDSPPCDIHNSPQTSIRQDGASAKERSEDEKDQGKRRRSGKRPDMQVYVPRARQGQRESKSEEKDESPVASSQFQDIGKENRELSSEKEDVGIVIPDKSDHQRKVQVKSKGRAMRVTVLKESPPSATSSAGNESQRIQTKTFEKSQPDKPQTVRDSPDVETEGSYHSSSQQKEWENKAKKQPSPGNARGKDRDFKGGGQSNEKDDQEHKSQPVSGKSKDSRRVFLFKEEALEARKSYSKNHRSNSNDSGSGKKDDHAKELEQGASRTFPRSKGPKTRSGGNQEPTPHEKVSKEGGGGKSGNVRDNERFYWGMRRQRTGSISSEASAASNNGSFYSGSSDVTEDDEPEHILDWGAEVEKAHLEEVARLVNDGAQRLTSSLDDYPARSAVERSRDDTRFDQIMSISADRLPPSNSATGSPRPPRKRNRHRKHSSRQGSRDSSVHSSIHGDDNGNEGSRRRRRHNRHRRSSQESRGHEEQQEYLRQLADSFPPGLSDHDCGGAKANRSGLQVTVGQHNRHVELSAGQQGRRRHTSNEMAESYTVDSGAEDWDKEVQHNMARSWREDESSWHATSPLVQRKGNRGGDGEGQERKARLRSDSENAGALNIEGDRFREKEKERHKEAGQSRDWHRDQLGGRGRENERDRHREVGIDRHKDKGGRLRKKSGDHTNGPQEAGLLHQQNYDQRIVHPAYDASHNVHTNRGRGRGQPNKQTGSGRMSESGGGLIRMPVVIKQHDSTHNSQIMPDRHQIIRHAMGEGAFMPSSGSHGSSNTRGPVHGTKQLFDPSNPSKPIIISGGNENPSQPAPLKFEESDSASSPQSGSGFAPLSPDVPHGAGPPHPYPAPPSHMYPPDYPPMYGYRPRMPPPHFMAAGPYMRGYPPGPMPPHMFYHGYPQMPGAMMPPPYFNSSETESDMMLPGSKGQTRMIAEQILRDSHPFDCQLGNIISRRPLSEDSIRALNQIRAELQSRLERVILLDIEVASKHTVEQALWKSVYYQVIEAYRRRMSEEQDQKLGKVQLMEVLDEGTRFFESLLKKLQTTYEFDLDKVLETGPGLTESGSGGGRHTKLALLCSQRVLMFLGDIARYKEQSSDSTNYGKARQWYLKAQKIHPRNGRPYNQLAILAVYTRRKLDAVYYYMRSLAASNPILTARESLMSIFDEVRRKVDSVEKKRFEDRQQRLELRKKRQAHGPRVEIWVLPDGTSSTQDTDREGEDGLEEDLSTLSAVELNKRFVLTYLNVHGKLFTKINFEVFAESSSLMLQEFESLIQRSPCVFSSTRLLQLMAINMFSIDNTALKDESLEENCRSLLQEHAVEIALDMFGLLVRRSAELMELQQQAQADGCPEVRGHSHGEEPIPGGWSELLSEDLHNILPALKTWVDWMMCHAHLWNPQPFNRPPDLGPQIDVWANLAKFCDLLNGVETKHGCLIREQKSGYEPVILHEDSTLSGFVPMLSAPQEIFYADSNVDKRQAEDWLRVEKLRLFGEYLCGVEPPMLGYSVQTGSYFSLAPTASQSEEKLHIEGEEHAEASGDESDDVEIEYGSSGDEGREGTVKDDIEKLKDKKAELKKRRQQREKDHESREAILDSHKHAKIELEIRPVFLIPDTNCFIDHFSSLQKILQSKKYTLVLPLVVINELEGLARGARPVSRQGWSSPEDQAEHARLVQSQSQAALTFLHSEFEAKNPNLRALTSRGSVLETIAFCSEEEEENAGINDDIILNCCLHYCKDMARDFMPKGKDQPVHLLREVVLLTEDRNLRLKAHTHNVPVRDVPRFKRWSKIP